MKIVIHTGTNAQAEPYAQLMFKSAQQLANNPQHIEQRRHVINDDARGSNGHGLWLKEAFEQIVASIDTIHIICDADVVFLHPGWDDDLCQLFLCEGISCLATSYEKIGGPSTGQGTVQTYKGRPNVTFIAFAPYVDMLKFDPSHQKHQHMKIVTEEQSVTFGIPVGYELFRDTAWELPDYLRKHGWLDTSRVMIHERENPQILTKDICGYCEEFVWEDKPFIAHQRGTSSKKFNVDPVSKLFVKACEDHLDKINDCT